MNSFASRQSLSGSSKRPALMAAVALLAATLCAGPSIAATCDDVTVPDTAGSLVLNGLGLRKATFLKVHVYVGALYLPQKSGDAQQILAARQPWQAALHFVRDVDASDIREAIETALKKVAGDKFGALQARFTTLSGLVTDLKEGQTLSFANDPAKGMKVEIDGKGGALIEGEDFAAAMLGTWIGAGSPNPELKSGMLGGACK
jgi:hypothetical protein